MMPVDQAQLERVLAQIRTTYGSDSIRQADTYSDPKRISTGSLELDLITRGGIPLGRISHWYGGQFSGKSLVSLNTIANAQRMGLTCAFYDVEKQFNAKWAKKHGVDVKSLLIVDGTIIEDIGKKMEVLLGSVNLHVIDSVPPAVSIDELSAKTEEWRPGISARAWGKVLRRIQERFDSEENALILINHVGTVFNKYAGGEEPKGAKFIEYLSSLSIEFRRSTWLYRHKDGHLTDTGTSEDTISGQNEPEGIEFSARVKKSRVSKPFASARMRLDFSSGEIDDMWSLAKAAILYELVDKRGSWYSIEGADKKVQGENGLRDHIEKNPDFKQSIIDHIQGIMNE